MLSNYATSLVIIANYDTSINM